MDIITREVHKPIRNVKNFRKVVSYHKNDIWSMDLCDMTEFEDVNQHYKFILTVIDVYTRYAWAKPLKNKSAIEVKNAIESIIKESKAYPKKFYVDEGKEFYNKTLDNLRNKLKIDIYSTYGVAHSSIIERFNRSLKSLMYKQFTLNQNRVWYNILDQLVEFYNNRFHKGIENKPNEVYNNNIIIEKPDEKIIIDNSKFKINDKVRISYKRQVFDKGYLPNWTWEIFTISKILDTNPKTYILKDYNGDELKGSFYREELQLSRQPEDFYLIEKVIDEKKVRNKKQYLVKWLGYSDKFNSWISEDDFKKLKEN